MVEFNGKWMKRQTKNNENYKFRIFFFFWGGEYHFHPLKNLRFGESSLLQGLKGSAKEANLRLEFAYNRIIYKLLSFTILNHEEREEILQNVGFQKNENDAPIKNLFYSKFVVFIIFGFSFH